MSIIWPFVRRYMLPYAHWYVAGIVCMVITNWVAVTIPLYVKDGVDAVAKGSEFHGDAMIAAWWVAGLGVLVIGIRTASRLFFFTPGRLVEAAVKRDLFARMLDHQPAFLTNWPTGDLISRVSNDTNMLRILAGFATLSIVNTTSILVLTATQMVRISPTLAALSAVPVVAGFIAVQFFMGPLQRVIKEIQDTTGDLSDRALASYQGVATIQAFDAHDAFLQRFGELNDRYLDAVLRRTQLRTFFGPILTFGAAVNVFVLLRWGGPMVLAGTLTEGDLVAFIALVALLTGPLAGMSFLIALVKQAQTALERIDAVMGPPVDRPEGPNGVKPGPQPPRIDVQSLSFHYPDDTHPVLVDVSFTLPAGGTLGIMGPTGSGKSTLLRVLSRLYNPPRGTVLIDGVDALDLDLDTWRERMTLVPQRSYLFSESLSENILLGKGEPGLLERVITLSALDVDVAALPQGLETQVGEAGVTLSGGQRQRTAIARGLARPSSMLILDDVLSAVDHKTEQQLIQTLRQQSPRPTTVLVAHRVSALQHADLILVLEAGRVVASGTHHALLQQPGIYRDTWDHQTETADV